MNQRCAASFLRFVPLALLFLGGCEPQAEDSLTRKWDRRGVGTELIGVCAISESGILAWDAQGQPDQDLERLVDTCLPKEPDRTRWMQVLKGKKNRLLVFRVQDAPPPPNTRPRSVPQIVAVSTDHNPWHRGSLSVPGPRQLNWGPTVWYETFAFAAEPTERTAVAHVNQFEDFQESSLLNLRAGDSATLRGVTFSVVSIRPLTWKDAANGLHEQGGATWLVRIKQTGTARPGEFYRLEIDENVLVSESGNRLSQEEATERHARMRGGPQPGDPELVRNARMYRLRGVGAISDYILTRNPDDLGSADLTAAKNFNTEIQNIPLDPK